MSFAIKGVLAALLGGLCLLGIVGVFSGPGSVRSYISDHYATAPSNSVVGATPRTQTYKSSAAAPATAAAIAGAFKPAERVDQPAGTFLRYRDDMVSVSPAPDGGSFITVDNANDGYTRWFPYVGGVWGTGSSPGGVFRGGGPGVGK